MPSHAQPVSQPTALAGAHAYAVPAAQPMVVMGSQVTRREAGGFDVEWNVDSVLNKASLRLPTRVIWVGCVNLRVSKVRMITELTGRRLFTGLLNRLRRGMRRT